MFSTDMTTEELIKAFEEQRKRDIDMMKMWRDHYQREIDRLEGREKKHVELVAR